ncbi:MAG: hypothetical protein EAZ55_01355 [Cytophagales bacterium]|nr:MAG: hypothetical protein EAZ55_01355 [Cytophagales bacterium]
MKIQRLQLFTSAIESLQHFYTNVLELPLLESRHNRFALKVGHSYLQFIQQEDALPPAQYHFAFNIPANQIDNAAQWLQEKNIDLMQYEGNTIIDFPNWKAKALYFLDPAGNVVEMIARQDVSNAHTPFNANSLYSISEIGLPVPQIAPFFSQLQQSTEVELYSHISNTDTFCAAGSPEGLFIIVPLERKWFPSDIINQICPLQVEVEGLKKAQLHWQELGYSIISV